MSTRDRGGLLPPIGDEGPSSSYERAGALAGARDAQVHELVLQLQLEERIRGAAETMLAGLDGAAAVPASVEWQQRKKLQQQADASARAIRDLKTALRAADDGDDEVSSGDEEPHPIDDAALDDEPLPSLSSPLQLTSPSAASSAQDLSDLDGSPASASSRATHVAKLLDTLASLAASATPAAATDRELAVARVEDCLRSAPAELALVLPWDRVLDVVRPFLLSSEQPVFCLGLRLARAFMLAPRAVTVLVQGLQLELILISALGQDPARHSCRYHAVQIVREAMGVRAAVARGVCCALVAVAETSEDPLHQLCIETLAELMVVDPERALGAGATRVLLETMADTRGRDAPAYALALCMAFVAAADGPQLRARFLRDGADFSAVLTSFTDVQLYNFHAGAPCSLQTCAAVMKLLLRTWVGLHCFDINLLVQCLTVPVADVQRTLLDVVDASVWLAREPQTPKDVSAYHSALAPNQFTAMLFDAYMRAGLFDRLETLQTAGETVEVQARARSLAARLMALAAALMPQPQLLALHARARALNAPAFGLPTAAAAFLGSEALVCPSPPAPSIDAFVRFGKALDDASFKRLVASTHVLDTKVFAQWNWDALMELVQGPLRSARRMDEVTRGTKFMKRLLSFFRPFKYRFSYLTATQENRRYAEVGKALMSTFLATDEGVRYLSTNKLFRQIAECLAQLDPLSGIVSADPLLSVKRFRVTLCSAYVEMIGALSREAVGQQFLAQVRIFNMYYRACDINREDIVRSIVCSLDYKLPGHPRLILAKAMSSSSVTTRVYTTEYIGYRLATAEPQPWLVELLVEQLYDQEFVVAKAAAQALYNLCVACVPNLDFLISMRPSFAHLREHKEPLLTLLMTRARGFELAIAELDLPQWAPSFHDAFVDKIEAYLENVETTLAGPNDNRAVIEPFTFPYYSRPPRHSWKDLANPPSHLYGELASTEEGCAFLKTNGDLVQLCDNIRAAASDCKTKPDKEWKPDELKRAKGALWAVGHVGARSRGACLLDLDVVECICIIARHAQVYSFRGTACYALALFAKSQTGAEFLHQCGWTVVYDTFQMPQGVTLPPDSVEPNRSRRPPRPMLSMEFPLTLPAAGEAAEAQTKPSIRVDVNAPAAAGTPALTPTRDDERRDNEKDTLLLAVSQLTSSVLSQSASKRLVALRSSHPALFQSGDVLNDVLAIFSSGHYKQAIRRFVFKLFDRKYILEKAYKRRR